MSVAQHIRDRAGRFRWMGLLVVWAVFIAMAAVLLVERAGVQYSAGQHKLGMLAANDAVPASSAIFGQKPTCLVITDSDQDGVDDVKDQFDQILLDMKIAHRDVDIATDGADAIPSLTSFNRVIVLMPSLDGLGTHLSDIMSWVSAGGSLMLAMPPDNSSYLQVIDSKLGIESAGYDYVKAESIVPSEDFMLGGGERYELSDPFDSSLSVSLRETARVWTMTGDAGAPLIWSNDCGSGRTVVCNIGIYDKVMRGFYAAAISLLGDATAYPVINCAVFYLDDFPSPVPSGDGTYIKRDYGLSIADFYTKVWWPDLQKLAQKYGIRYTGVMIENYEDAVNQTEPARQPDTTQFRYFGGMLLHYVYKRFFTGVVYSRSFAVTLVGMCVLTCMVTLAISTNVVISLGMVGALSIVRYRTAVKDPLDLLYLFWSITTGITAGAGMYALVALTAVVIVVMIAGFASHQDKARVYMMVIHYTGQTTGDDIVRAFGRTKFTVKSKTMRGDKVEMAVEVFSDGVDMPYADAIRALDGVEDLTLIQYNGEYHG